MSAGWSDKIKNSYIDGTKNEGFMEADQGSWNNSPNLSTYNNKRMDLDTVGDLKRSHNIVFEQTILALIINLNRTTKCKFSKTTKHSNLLPDRGILISRS